MADVGEKTPAGALRVSLWNLLYRVVAATDHSRTAWTAILSGAALVLFKEPLDALPLADNEGSRAVFRDRFFGLPDHRVYDLFEFLLLDDRGGLKEVDRKLIRRRLNPVLTEEGASVRLLRDRFVPVADEMGLDAVAGADEELTLFDLPAARRHLESAVAFLSRRPAPASREAVREAALAVAATVHALRKAGGGAPGGGVSLGTVAPLADRFGIAGGLLRGIDALLGRAAAAGGLPVAPPEEAAGGGAAGEPSPGTGEAALLVVFCASVIRFLLDRAPRPS